MAKIYLKKGDNARALLDTLTINGAAIDLTGYSTLTCVFRKGDTTVRTAATVSGDVTEGSLTCTIPDEVSSVPGTWQQEWEVVYASGAVITVPTKGYNTIVINDDLG